MGTSSCGHDDGPRAWPLHLSQHPRLLRRLARLGAGAGWRQLAEEDAALEGHSQA